MSAKDNEKAEAGSTPRATADKATKEQLKEEAPAEEAPSASASTEASQDVVASPAARKRARELNIDLSQVQAQDPLGRIRPEDVERAAQAPTPSAAPQPVAQEEFEKPTIRERKIGRATCRE